MQHAIRRIVTTLKVMNCFNAKPGWRSPILMSLLFWLYSCSASTEDVKPRVIQLKNDRLHMEVTPSFGGRVLSFSMNGQKNVLKVGAPVSSLPEPAVTANADNIGYLGHEVWVGPQSEWWVHQTVNPVRRAAHAHWPPDPFLVLAKNKVLKETASEIVLEGVPSPVSGLQLRKSFALLEEAQNGVELEVAATNIRDEVVTWDIWFNTRVHPSTKVYVPAASMNDIRLAHAEDQDTGPLVYSLEDKIFSLDVVAPAENQRGRKGKVFIQPAAGWMAGFTGNQVLIITFPLHPRTAIHSQQGQVELYLDYRYDSPGDGLLEMEVHAPYRKLEPGHTMRARERWYLFAYHGPDTRASHTKFLGEHKILTDLHGYH